MASEGAWQGVVGLREGDATMIDLESADLPFEAAAPTAASVYTSWVASLPGVEHVTTVAAGSGAPVTQFIVTSWPDEFNPSPVPEPSTWAMIIAGFGAIGATLRRRRFVADAASRAGNEKRVELD
jgi:hypothetical protein